MVSETVTAAALETLRAALPDPFSMPEHPGALFGNLDVLKILRTDGVAAGDIVGFVESSNDAALIRVAILVLSRFDPGDCYTELLRILTGADKAKAEAFEPGLWLFDLPDARIADDLVGIAESTDNPNPLLLLQRDVARTVKDRLQYLIEHGDPPGSLYAMYSFGYALGPEDRPFLKGCSRKSASPDLRALAGLHLLELGSIEGTSGILAGLQSTDQALRAMTVLELSRHVPSALLEASGYTSQAPTEARNEQAQALIDAVVDYWS